MPDFLLEIGLEEIPARMIESAEEELKRRVTGLVERERLGITDATVETYSTPRRVAVRITNIAASQADVTEQLTGPSWHIAFKDGAPTAAAEAFAKKAGVTLAELEKVTNAKGEYVGATVKRTGRTAVDVLTSELPKEIAAIYWAKNMYWRLNKPERFVRPVRWLVALLDSAVIPLEFAGIKAGNTSRGHRILHGESLVTIPVPAQYAEALKSAFVLADVPTRRESIRKALDRVTRTIAGARWREDHDLVETVTHLTEWPSVLLGNFEPEYLALPEEVLVTVMRDHQKYFAVEDANGKLAPHFLTVLNTQVDVDGEAIIRNGNERVLRSRFKDARFFWDVDQKTSLTSRTELLKSVTFQKELGSYAWKTEQNLAVAEKLAAGIACDHAALKQAVELAKTDLTAELVKEFTELQGIVGGLYARAQGLGEAVAQAIYAQYTPASTEDKIPATIEGQLLGLADRIQTIAAMFRIGNAPTGSKDPFALRRAANAIIKILAESSLPLTIPAVIAAAGESAEVTNFLHERLSFYLKDVRGYAYDVVAAVLAADATNVTDAIARAEALTAVRGSDDFVAISAAFKRTKNILRQAAEKNETIPAQPDANVLTEAEEKQLLTASAELAPKVAALAAEHNYAAALEQIATLRGPIDAFFEKVMVMAPDVALRQSRLALLQSVLTSFNRIADFSEIVSA